MREGTLHLAWPCWCIFCHSRCAFTPHRWRSSSIAVWLSCFATASHKLLPVTWFQCPQGRVHDICPIWEYIFSCFAARHVHRISKYTVIHNIKMHKSCLFSSCAYRLEVKFRKGILAWLLLYNSSDRLHFYQEFVLTEKDLEKVQHHPSITNQTFQTLSHEVLVLFGFWAWRWKNGCGFDISYVKSQGVVCMGFVMGFAWVLFCLVVSAVGIHHSPTVAAIAIHVYHPFRLIRYQVSNGLGISDAWIDSIITQRTAQMDQLIPKYLILQDVRTWFTADSEAVMAVLATTYFWNIPETFSTSKDETKSIWKSLMEGLFARVLEREVVSVMNILGLVLGWKTCFPNEGKKSAFG